MNNLKIKICGMTDLENISSVIELEPDYLGFIFYPGSPRYVKVKNHLDEVRSLAKDVKKVGVFVNEKPLEIMQIRNRYGLDSIQLHGNENPDYCRELKRNGIEVIKVFNVSSDFNFQYIEEYVSVSDFFLFDTKTNLFGGSGIKFAWDLLDKYNLDIPFFLSGGITPSDAENILSIHHPSLYGVDVNSGFEISPGLKDITKLHTFINKLRNS